uniref:Atonal-related protein 1 n=1 Tax=Nematostella vectensis TaxID=45351 RepID=D9N199_NEMVE|nr:atonal-related protein 1 [Nematostella vectensis]
MTVDENTSRGLPDTDLQIHEFTRPFKDLNLPESKKQSTFPPKMRLHPEESSKHKITAEARLRRLRANDRERRRIQSINVALEALRKAVPNTRSSGKLTKLDTLLLARDYIKHLNEILQRTRDENLDRNKKFGQPF